MFKDLNRDQVCFLPQSLCDIIDQDDLVFTLIKVVEQLDTSAIEAKYDTLGQNSYHPKMMIAILCYAYSQGVFSSRRIHDLLCHDVRYMYLAGMHRPSFNRICEFRRSHQPEMQDQFVQIVRISQAVGAALLASISIDGSKIPASVSKRKTRDREQLAEEYDDLVREMATLIEHAESIDRSEEEQDDHDLAGIRLSQLEQRKQLLEQAQLTLDENPNQKRINLTDPECREQKSIGPGYNLQIATDNHLQIIIAHDVTAEPNDVNQLIPMVEQIEDNTQSLNQPKAIYADAGYASGRALSYLDEKPNVTAYIPNREHVHPDQPEQRFFIKQEFDFDPSALTCRCPIGEAMRLESREMRRGVLNIKFKGTACPTCDQKHLCTEAKYRKVRMTMADHLVRDMNERMDSPAGKQAMAIRRQTVEPVFGQLKEQLGFRKFHLRGLAKVKAEVSLLCSAFNIKKLHKFLTDRGTAGVLGAIRDFSVNILFFTRKIANTVHFCGFFRIKIC